jgi:hypothetical protein
MSKTLKNKEHPFTGLFLSLRQHEVEPSRVKAGNYSIDTLKEIYHHADNAIEDLMLGLQNIGNLASVAKPDTDDAIQNLNGLGFFISLLSNLTEALRDLHTDIDYELQERSGNNY